MIGVRWVAMALCIMACQRTPGRLAWHDASPHAVRFVQVDSASRIETLDWGGRGPTIVLLAGLGNSAHVFDNFAPQLTDHYHVVGLTRRGFGASSQPPTGDLALLVNDIATALDSLALQRVILIGHSIAGDELTGFAAAHPDRVAALVYLDAAYDRSRLGQLLQATPIPAAPAMTAADSASPAAATAYVNRILGLTLPEAEVRASTHFDSAGRFEGEVTPDSLANRILAHLPPPPYAGVHSPVLAIYAASDSVQLVIPYYAALDSAGRPAAQRLASTIVQLRDSSMAQFSRAVPTGEVLEIPGANHYVFISNQRQVLSAVRTFLARAVRDVPSSAAR